MIAALQEERSETKRDKGDGLEGGDTTATPASHGRTICFGLGFYSVKPVLVHFPFLRE